jgi:cleavage stimulation factor subunit 2
MWNGGNQNAGGAGAAGGGLKHDIFVGNLAFNTTEEQLHQVFSEVGRVLKVRMVTDQETGKPRGFAFVEFQDPQAALSAIRNMNDYELNGRNVRVNFSNSSHLEALAGKLGMDLPNASSQQNSGGGGGQQGGGGGGGNTQGGGSGGVGTVAVAEALKGMSKGELYDVVQKLKEIADRDPEEARRILSGHPQLPEALLFCMSKLEMVQTPIASNSMPPQIVPPTTTPTMSSVPPPPAPPTRAADPRQRAMDPRARAADPRARDPRAAAPQQQQQWAAPPGLDPALVQQVMSLTPTQIAQLPPDKSQSIMALRNQITGGR